MFNKRNPSPVLFWLLIIFIVTVSAILVTLIMREYFQQTSNDLAWSSIQESLHFEELFPVKNPESAAYDPPQITFTNQAVQLAWFYKPPTDGNLNPLAENFDFFILTKTDEPTRDALKELNVETKFLQYLRLEAIYDPGDCDTQPKRNQVADQIGDYCMINEQHPDWFLLDQDGQRMIGSDGYVIMDPGNPGWRAFWLERAIISQEKLGWDGVFLDNVEGSINRRRRFEQMPAAYPTEEAYEAAILGFLEFIYTGYFQPQGRPLMANIVYFSDDFWFEALQYLDGAMDENWAVSHSGKYRNPEEWEEDMRRAEQTQALGKSMITVSQGDQHDLGRQRFAFASYLLVNSGGAYFRYTTEVLYNETWLYSNYYIDLGEPLGPRYQEDNLWRRDFIHGSITVDPAKHIGTINTP